MPPAAITRIRFHFAFSKRTGSNQFHRLKPVLLNVIAAGGVTANSSYSEQLRVPSGT